MTGQDLLNLSRNHLGEQYLWGVLVPKGEARWTGPWDCAEFASWCVYQISRQLYGCDNNTGPPAIADAYTGFWGRDARGIGIQIRVEHAAKIPGAAILRLGAKVGHIALSDGSGGTVEAKSRLEGVTEDKVAGRRWSMGVLVPWIKYDQGAIYEPADPLPPVQILRLAWPYMTGEPVRLMQRAMQDRGYYLAKVDGVFGPLTHGAVIRFQRERGLVVDGEVGRQTLRALGLG